MALPPRFAGQVLLAPASHSNHVKHTLEIYLDYVCPFSAKMFHTLHTSVRQLIRQTPKYERNLTVIFRQHIQPWHPSSTLTHEAGAAVLKLAPGRFWDFSAALFERQRDFFDEAVVKEGRNATYGRLARLAMESIGVGEGEMMELLRIEEQGEKEEAMQGGGSLNSGNWVTADIKQMVKAARVVGVHVSPTVFFDGVEEKAISSGFTPHQWEDWLETNVT